MTKPKKKDSGRVGNTELKPLTDADRARLFPNGPVSLKMLRELKKQSSNHLKASK